LRRLAGGGEGDAPARPICETGKTRRKNPPKEVSPPPSKRRGREQSLGGRKKKKKKKREVFFILHCVIGKKNEVENSPLLPLEGGTVQKRKECSFLTFFRR